MRFLLLNANHNGDMSNGLVLLFRSEELDDIDETMKSALCDRTGEFQGIIL